MMVEILVRIVGKIYIDIYTRKSEEVKELVKIMKKLDFTILVTGEDLNWYVLEKDSYLLKKYGECLLSLYLFESIDKIYVKIVFPLDLYKRKDEFLKDIKQLINYLKAYDTANRL